MLNIFAFIVCVVAIGCTTALLSQYMKERAERRRSADDEVPSDMQQQLDELEERIRVLERIVTENRIDLREQIDRL